MDLSNESEVVEVVQTDEKLLAQTETVRQAQRSVDEDEDYVVPERLLKLYQATAEVPRRIVIHRQEHVKREVETMLVKNIIEPADGPWSSPVVLAKKER